MAAHALWASSRALWTARDQRQWCCVRGCCHDWRFPAWVAARSSPRKSLCHQRRRVLQAHWPLTTPPMQKSESWRLAFWLRRYKPHRQRRGSASAFGCSLPRPRRRNIGLFGPWHQPRRPALRPCLRPCGSSSHWASLKYGFKHRQLTPRGTASEIGSCEPQHPTR